MKNLKLCEMKKLFILLAAILFGISASFAQGPTVKVYWNDNDCECGSVPDKFKISISIYDDANSTWVIQNSLFWTPDATPTYMVCDVPEVEDYCDKTHEYTPDFTVTTTVWLIMTDESSCCDATNNKDADCRDFYNNGQFDTDMHYLE